MEWIPGKLAARSGGVEVYRREKIELRQGDRVRWTRNDQSLGLVNSQTADVTAVGKDTVTFRLENGGTLELNRGDSQLRHIDRAWASTVHAFQGRTVDTVIAAMEADHPHLTTQKSFYVEISRARHRAELITDDRKALGEHLEQATGERVAALESLEPAPEAEKSRVQVPVPEPPDDRERGMEPDARSIAGRCRWSGRGRTWKCDRSPQRLRRRLGSGRQRRGKGITLSVFPAGLVRMRTSWGSPSPASFLAQTCNLVLGIGFQIHE